MNKYWFRKREGIKSKDIGWGFVPISWKGIVSYVLLFVLVVSSGIFFDIFHATTLNGFCFLFTLIILLICFSLINKSKTQK